MNGLGSVIVLLVTAAFVTGLFLVVTAFSREPPPANEVPPAQVVVGASTPIRTDKRRLRISAGRLIGGLFLILVGAAAVMLILAGLALAAVSNH